MKIKTFLFLALTSMAFASCSSDDDYSAEKVRNVSFAAGMPQVEMGSRTSFDVTENPGGTQYAPMWSAHEQLSVLYGSNVFTTYKGTNAEKAPKTTFELAAQNQITKGSTVVAITKPMNFGDNVTRGIDPDVPGGDAVVYDKYDASTGILSTQFKSKQTIESLIDETSEVLVSKPVTLTEAQYASPVELQFKRLNAIIRLNIIAKGDVKYPLANKSIVSVHLSTEDVNNDFGGMMDINTKNGTFTKRNCEQVAVTGALNHEISKVGSDYVPVYVSVLPTVTDKIKVTFHTTDGITYERLLTGQNVKVEEGKVTTLNVSFGDKDVKVIVKP